MIMLPEIYVGEGPVEATSQEVFDEWLRAHDEEVWADGCAEADGWLENRDARKQNPYSKDLPS